MNRYPKMSIVTVSYNQSRYLEKAICSVLDQSYPNLEYIIVDGGSTDNSVKIIRKYEKYLTYWVSEPDRGQGHALNKGLSRCTGDIMGWLNSDDYYLPLAFERFREAWRENPAAGAWVGSAFITDSKGKTLELKHPGNLDRDAIADWENNGFSQPACLFSKQAWEKAKPINESLFIAIDLDFWLKIAAFFPLYRITPIQAAATRHPQAKTQAHRNLMYIEMWKVLFEHGYQELAMEIMLKKLNELDDFKIKVSKLTNSSLYKLIRPFVKKLHKIN